MAFRYYKQGFEILFFGELADRSPLCITLPMIFIESPQTTVNQMFAQN